MQIICNYNSMKETVKLIWIAQASKHLVFRLLKSTKVCTVGIFMDVGKKMVFVYLFIISQSQQTQQFYMTGAVKEHNL